MEYNEKERVEEKREENCENHQIECSRWNGIVSRVLPEFSKFATFFLFALIPELPVFNFN
jgi:hypothetical protein